MTLSSAELTALFVRGGPYLKRQDVEALYEIASRGKNYVEIGTMYGGSAVVAGLAGCEVDCIDLWGKVARPVDVRENWKAAGLKPSKLHLHVQRHPPWPDILSSRKFDIGLIDGNHSPEACRLDWQAMKEHVTGYVLFHDASARQDVFEVFLEASREWEIVAVPFVHQFGILRPVTP